ncbi:non-ribosomal peptide synthetase/type I polyketide synthase, partial [Streptomyces clavuligerus]
MPERVDRFPVDQRDLRWVPEGAVGACPASRLQTGVLYHNVKGDAHVYHDVLSCTVEHAPGTGCLDETAFRSALTSLVAAHPVLRTGFVVEGAGSPLHVLHPEAEIDCAFFDVRDEGPVAVERWVTAERAAPFDITVPGLLRVAVHRTGERRSVVSLSYHHALLDTRSAAALAAELLSRATGSEPAVRTEVDASPAHLALERAAERSADQRAYWADVLEGIEPTEIPLPGRPPGRPTTAEAEASVPVPPELSEGIRALAARTGVTSRSVHAAAHLALLSYVSGEPDVVTGLVADLPPETGELGFFVNILPCRLDVGRRAWQDLIQAVADAEEAARPHSRYPFALIEADAGARFCATEFAHTELPDMDPPPATGVRVTGVHLHERTDYFHLLVSVLEQPSTGRTRVTLHYPPALISSEQAEHYAELYGRLLRHAVGAPDEPAVDALGHWSEQQGLTARAATGETTRGGGTPVLAEIVRRLRSAPDTDIVQEYAGRRETAHGLAVRVSRARRALLAADAGPGRRVACFLERGADPLVALLAVWSVGASYVPIDPALPPDRQRALLALVGCAAALRSPGVPPDARVWEGPEAVLTTAPATAARVGPGPDDRPIGADGPASVPDGQNGHDDWTAELGSWTVPAPDSEAYVLFTSGSTGRPKAVSMPHRGVANLVSWQLAEPEFARPRRVSQFAALSFDVSVQEMACAAASGSTLVVIPDAVRRNPEELLGFLGHELIEVAFLPVAAVHQLTVAWEAFGITPGRLRYVVTAGEALVVTGSVRGFCQAVGAELINQYGPTETHVTLCHRLGPDPAAWPHRPPIGHAIHNTTLRILDPLGRPVPRGTPGELHIGGASVADGYADAGGTDPLTAERFTHDAAGGGRSYRTGDIVRVREEDGAVVFVGRADEQTKIRGHRVEPAEVATVLLRHPGVRHCAVRALPVGGAGLDLVAFVEPSAPGLTAEQLREHLREALPEYAVPAHVEILDRLPLTRSGKIDSRALRITARPAHEAATAAPHPVGAVEAQVLRVWEEVLGRPVTSPRLTFFAAGGNSLLLMRLYLGLRTAFGIEFPLHELFRHTTAAAFAEFVRERETATGAEAGAGTGPEAEAGTGPGTGAARGRGGHGPTHEDADVTAVHRTQDGTRPMDIAVVGMSCRFPGAPDVDAFWRLIREGTDNVTFFSEEELRGARVPGPLLADPDYVRAGRPLEHPGAFDAAFFGISPREAELTDPQARLFLELCWLALEDAGHDPARYPGQIGVFATSARDTYFRNNVLPTLGAAARQDGSVLGLQADIGNLGDYLATRVSYRLGLRGPGVTAQTACSSGLVVVHLACQSLLTGESDMALAGGVAVNAQHGSGYVHEEGSITSSDGRCRPFDAAAGGTVFGDGGGVVLLKRVADALADGDRIIAVIKGTAINNDGSDKMTYSAPGVDGQARAIARAQRIAGVDPRTIGFVEAHGTGTPLGDPIEIAALTAAFGLGPVERPFCAIGSVKGQIGHLTTAAGTAGLIKALLAVERGLIPAAVHVDEPSPHVPFAGSPFYLPREPRPWDGTRRAGVSSFGVGGTNAHAVIEQAPDRAGHLAPGAADAGGTAGSVPRDELYVLSARTITALDAQRTRLSAHLHTHDGLTPAAVAHTLARGRAAFPYRMAVAAGSTGEAAARLAAAPLPESPATGTGLPVVFAFPGQGAQYEGMGRALYKGDVTFRTEVDRCAEIIRSLTGQDVREVMFGPV